MELKEHKEGKRGRKRRCLLMGQMGFSFKRGTPFTHAPYQSPSTPRLSALYPATHRLFRFFLSFPLRFQLAPSSFYLSRQMHTSSLCIHPSSLPRSFYTIPPLFFFLELVLHLLGYHRRCPCRRLLGISFHETNLSVHLQQNTLFTDPPFFRPFGS